MPGRNVPREKQVAVALAGTAGFLDVVGYLTLAHLFTAHMTGNTSKLGVALGHGELGKALPLALALPLFAAGVAAGTLLVDARRARTPLYLEAALVAAFMAVGVAAGRHGDTVSSPYPYYVLETFATLALGLQTASLTDVEGTTVRTSYVSGVLTNLTQGLVRRTSGACGGKPLALLATILGAYLVGAVGGALTLRAISFWCLAAPLAVLLVAAAGRRREE
ncbi:MAG TPA: YoaK family protein [Gaiellaceae bacterium]|jgi:uncharacterized membrane protein YoaK (UPF0700 family)|nr:YoaK family protein [Gaiellaceae bacterium]